MNTSSHDPLEKAEHLIRDIHDSAHRRLHPVYQRYPLLFIILLTVSTAAIFHGIDELLNQFIFFTQNPLFLIAIGILGLFATGSLYKKLGKG